MSGLLTAQSLQDYASLIGAVVVLVQFFKGAIDTVALRIFKAGVATKYVTYLFALALVVLKAHAEGALALEALPYIGFNAVLVALAAMKAFEEFHAAGVPAVPFDANR